MGKSHARNPTQNPSPNRPEPTRTTRRLSSAPCPQALRSARAASALESEEKKKTHAPTTSKTQTPTQHSFPTASVRLRSAPYSLAPRDLPIRGHARAVTRRASRVAAAESPRAQGAELNLRVVYGSGWFGSVWGGILGGGIARVGFPHRESTSPRARALFKFQSRIRKQRTPDSSNLRTQNPKLGPIPLKADSATKTKRKGAPHQNLESNP